MSSRIVVMATIAAVLGMPVASAAPGKPPLELVRSALKASIGTVGPTDTAASRLVSDLPGLHRAMRRVMANPDSRIDPSTIERAYLGLVRSSPDYGTWQVCASCVGEIRLPGEKLERARHTVSSPELAMEEALHPYAGASGDDPLSDFDPVVFLTRGSEGAARPIHPGSNEYRDTARILAQALRELDGRDLDEAAFRQALHTALKETPRPEPRAFGLENVTVDAATGEASLSFRARGTKIRIVSLRLDRILDRLKYFAFGSAGTGGSVYLFGPASEEREGARENRAHEIADSDRNLRAETSRDLVWAERIERAIQAR